MIEDLWCERWAATNNFSGSEAGVSASLPFTGFIRSVVVSNIKIVCAAGAYCSDFVLAKSASVRRWLNVKIVKHATISACPQVGPIKGRSGRRNAYSADLYSAAEKKTLTRDISTSARTFPSWVGNCRLKPGAGRFRSSSFQNLDVRTQLGRSWTDYSETTERARRT